MFQILELLINYIFKEIRIYMKYYVVKTMRLASYLCSKGFKIIKEQPDRNNPKYKVWLFEDTVQLRGCLMNYKK